MEMRSLEERIRDIELLCDEAYKARVKCKKCKGESIISNNKSCPVCNGTGWIEKDE